MKSRKLKSIALWFWLNHWIKFWEVILSLMPKSIVPILVNILQYKLWLWDQNWRHGTDTCVLRLKTVILTIFKKCWLAARVWRMEINPIGVHYALGHRCLAGEERFEIGNVFTLKLVIFWKIFGFTKNHFPQFPLALGGSNW